MVLQGHPGISLAILFGSLATGTAGPGSDLDLAVYNYETIDWAIVHAIARHRLGDFKSFAQAILRLR